MDTNYNGTNLSTYGFTTYGITKPLNPQQRQEIIDSPKRLGVEQVYKKFTGNTLIVRGVLTGTSPSNLVDKIENLSGFLYSDNDVEIIFSDQDDRYWNVQFLEPIEVKRTESLALLDLIFTANNPLGWAVTTDTDDQTITTLDDTFIITNSGHYYAYPVYTITFNQAQSHIYLQNNNIPGNRIDISKSFATNDELEIDSFDMTIRLNGTINPIGLGDGGESKAEFPILRKSVNEMQIGSDDEDINIDIETVYRKTYLY